MAMASGRKMKIMNVLISTQANTKTIKSTDKDNLIGSLAIIILGLTKTIRDTATEKCFG